MEEIIIISVIVLIFYVIGGFSIKYLIKDKRRPLDNYGKIWLTIGIIILITVLWTIFIAIKITEGV